MDTPITTLITTILCGILVLVGGTTILGSYASYNPSLDTSGLGNITSVGSSSLAGITTASADLQQTMQKKQDAAGVFGFLDSFINIGMGMLSTLFVSLSFVTDAIYALCLILGIPVWMFVLASIFFATFIGLAIASAIFRIRL